MMRSLYSAVSGIGVNQKSMDVIGNNIANVNTIGFKQGRAVFQDMLSQTLNSGKAPTDSRGGINPRQVGTGAYLVAVDNIFEQGTIKTTSRVHDVAIEGNGFFVLRGEGQTQFYSRAGDFNFDKTGYLTSPSGLRVQGWMSDPNTGVINYNTTVDDIFVSNNHQIMPARATTQVNYAGVLGTSATSSVFEFATMFTQADSKMNVFDALSAQSTGLGLTSTDSLRVKAHATKLSSMGGLYNANGQAMTLSSNVSTVSFTFSSGNTYDFKYSSVPTTSPSDLTFTSVGDLLDEINSAFTAEGLSANAVIEDGRIRVNNTGTASMDISSVTSQNSYLANLLGDLKGSYGANTGYKRGGEMFFQETIKATEHFNTFEELSNKISNTINGNVVSAGEFNVEFLENEWGLNDGETFNIVIGTVTATLTYREDPSQITNTTNQFHSLSQLVTALNTNTVLGPLNLDFRATDGGGIEIVNNSAGAVTISEIYTATSADSAGNTSKGVSPYMEGAFNVWEKTFAATERLNIADVSGKGKLSYSMADGATGILSGFSITKATSGDIFNKNILEEQGVELNAGQGTTSLRFLTKASENTNMRDLFNDAGQYCFFMESSDYIDFTAVVGGQQFTDGYSFAIAIDSTVEDMMLFIEEYLGLGSNYNTKAEVTMSGGVITVRGAKGAANDITSFSLNAHQPNGELTFTNSFGTPTKTHSAEGGQFVTDMPIYDQQGNRHLVRFEFSMFNESRNEWTMRISTDDPDISVYLNGAVTNELVMRFNSDGTPSYMYDRHSVPVRVISNPTFDLDPGNGANNVSNIAINVGTPGQRDGLTLSNATTTMNTNSQDGYPLGVLEQMLFNDAGEIVEYYTNNQVRTVGVLALATFQNNQGLLKVGDTMFAETANSGMAALGQPQSGSRGSIASSALEQSNVDLSNEFVSMIVTQRGFQANSRVVTTSDEMIQELLNMKR